MQSTGNATYTYVCSCGFQYQCRISIAGCLQTGIVMPNPVPFPVYKHLVVAPISPLPPPRHYRFQYQRAILRPSTALRTNSPSPFLKRVDKDAALSSTSNPSNVSPTSAPNSSFKGTQSGDSGPGSSSSSKAKSTRRGTPSTSLPTSVGSRNANGIGMESESEPTTSSSLVSEVGGVVARPSLASARKASEEARKALFSPCILFLFFLGYIVVLVAHLHL